MNRTASPLKYIAKLLTWGTRPAPALFLWGIVLTLGLAASAWCNHGELGVALVAPLFQLAGVVGTLWQLSDQRAQLEAKGVRQLIREWWAARPLYRYQTVTASLIISETRADTVSAFGQVRPAKSGLVEEQVSQLWAYVEAMNMQLGSLQETVVQHKREAQQAVDSTHRVLTNEINGLKETVTRAVAATPFEVVFGLWLVTLGTVLQAMQDVCGIADNLRCFLN